MSRDEQTRAEREQELAELVAHAICAEEQHQAELAAKRAKRPAKVRKLRWDKRYEYNPGFSLLKRAKNGRA